VWAFVIGILGTVFPVGNFRFSGWVPLGTMGNTVWVFAGSALIHSLLLLTGTAGSDDSIL